MVAVAVAVVATPPLVIGVGEENPMEAIVLSQDGAGCRRAAQQQTHTLHLLAPQSMEKQPEHEL